MDAAVTDSAHVPGGLRLDGPDGIAPWGGSLTVRCCGYLPRNRRWNHPHVFSPFWRLYYNFAPGHRIRFARRVIPLSPQRLVLVPEDILFHCESPTGAPGHLFVHFNFLPGWAPRLPEPRAITADEAIHRLVHGLASAAKQADHVKAGHLAAALVHWTFGRMDRESTMPDAPEPTLRTVLAHITGNLSGNLSNPILAHLAGMSLRAFIRAFHEQVGESPQAHVRASRIREAARRLAHTRHSIDQIAETSGFANRYYFTRCFTQAIGSPPATFRHTIQTRIG